MKKLMCLIALAFVLLTNVPSTRAQDSPITVGGGGGSRTAQATTPRKPFDKLLNLTNALKVRSVVLLVQMGVI